MSEVHVDVEGAPFKIGERVVYVRSIDETALPPYPVIVGKVLYFEYKCGCGQSYPEDPMIGVVFEENKTDEYWKEELIREADLPADLKEECWKRGLDYDAYLVNYHVFTNQMDVFTDDWQHAWDLYQKYIREEGCARLYFDYSEAEGATVYEDCLLSYGYFPW